MRSDVMWLIVGFGGQALFSLRFLVQWLTSERRRESVIPIAFWHLSLWGGLTLFAYAVHQGDPVFVVGQGLGVFIYLRNLWLIRRGPAHRPDDGVRA